MTVSLVRIRQILRRTLGERRRRPVGASVRAETLEQRQLLSGKRSYESIQAEEKAAHEASGQDHELVADGLPLSTGTASSGSAVAGAPPYDLAQTFHLNSLPGATKTIYLDFDGNTTSGTWWNSSYTGGAAFTTPAFSQDSSAAFSDTELQTIQQIWQRVAEDYAPFNVNVTTQDPGTAGIVRSGSGDNAWGIRVVIGGSYQDWFGQSSGGVAYLNTFGSSVDQNVFVFSNSLGNGEKNVAEAISHEAGHSLGLSHDGSSTASYYQGQGSGATGWAPIMGVGYYRELTQWSKGEYPGANNKEDDLAVITSGANGFGYRIDDYANTRTAAQALASTTSGSVKTVDVAGIIEQNTDQDWFSFTTTGGAVSLAFNGAARGTNLDIAASLYDSSGQLILTSNPPDLTTASISTTLAAGTYYVMVDGVGPRGLSDGYSDYGSLGQYFITGTIPDDGTGGSGGGGGTSNPNPSGLASISGRVWHDADADGTVDIGDGALTDLTVYLDANNNGVFDSGEQSAQTGVDGSYSLTGLAAGTYRLRELPPAGYKQVFPTANGARAVTVSTGQVVSNVDFRALETAAIGNLGASMSYIARQPATQIAATGTVTDPDTTIFTNFRLTAQLVTGSNSADRLAIRNEGKQFGQVGVSGSSVYYSGVRVGTFSGGSGSTKLTITFNSSATGAAVQAVLRNITYRSTATRPTAGFKTVQFVMTESNGVVGTPATKQIVT